MNKGNFDVIPELFHRTTSTTPSPPGTPPGIAGVEPIFRMFRTGFPDVKFTIDQMIGEGDYVATLVHGEGTHTGQFIAFPPSGKHAVWRSVGFFRIEDGKIARALGHPGPARAADPDRRDPAAAGRERRRHRGGTGLMGAAENVALIQRFYDEGWNANNLDVYDELVTPDFVDHQALPGLEPGREGFKMLNVMFRSAFPDVWVTVDQIVAEDDKVACRWTSTGHAQGRPVRHPADGQQGEGHRDRLVPDRGRQARRGLDQPRRRRADAPARRDPLAVAAARAAAAPRTPDAGGRSTGPLRA